MFGEETQDRVHVELEDLNPVKTTTEFRMTPMTEKLKRVLSFQGGRRHQQTFQQQP